VHSPDCKGRFEFQWVAPVGAVLGLDAAAAAGQGTAPAHGSALTVPAGEAGLDYHRSQLGGEGTNGEASVFTRYRKSVGPLP
jgi:hypothetical protein